MHVLVFGCTSGFGKAVTQKLLADGQTVSGISRTAPDADFILHETFDETRFRHYSVDVLDTDKLTRALAGIQSKDAVHGVVLNAGGPPAGNAAELSLKDYQDAGKLVLEWKIQAVLTLLPDMRKNKYGNIIFIESQSVKQPIEGLALSNTYRAAVTGFAKTLAGEVAPEGITVNVIAPGSHSTPAIERIIQARREKDNLSREETIAGMTASIPAGRFGQATELAALVCWLLSGESRFITGQTISHDGGNIKHLFG